MSDKILYFEGAGCAEAEASRETIGNCRIRTAFSLKNGKRVYLEIQTFKKSKKEYADFNSRWNWDLYCRTPEYPAYIMSCFEITDEEPNNDATEHKIGLSEIFNDFGCFEYTEKDITRFVNALGGKFDGIRVLPFLSGFHVFRTEYPKECLASERYNYGDRFVPDEDLLKARQRIYDDIWYKEQQRKSRYSLYQKYPVFMLYPDEQEPAILHFRNCDKEGINPGPIICAGIPADASLIPPISDNAVDGAYYMYQDGPHRFCSNMQGDSLFHTSSQTKTA